MTSSESNHVQPDEPSLTSLDRTEIRIVSMLESRCAVEAFEMMSGQLTVASADRFGELLAVINELSARPDFDAAVDAVVLESVRTPDDLLWLDHVGATSSSNAVVKLAAAQLLRTLGSIPRDDR